MGMKIGVISDTHDNVEKAEKAVSFFEGEGVEKVVHCGDMVAPFTAEIFDAGFDFYAVRGNNDGEWDLKRVVEEFGEFYNNIGELEIAETSICVYHGTEEEIVKGLTKKDYDYIFRGHTHQKKIEEHNGTTELNPGGIKLPGQEEDFHVATLNLENQEIEFHRIE
jgi:putative phosphoesterase